MKNETSEATQAVDGETTVDDPADVLRGVPSRTRRAIAVLGAICIPVALAVVTWSVFLLVDVVRSRPWSIAQEWSGSKEEAPTLFPVRQDGKWGYIDSNGRLVIGFQYDSAEGFSEGLAPPCSLRVATAISMSRARWSSVRGLTTRAHSQKSLAAVGGLGFGAGFYGFIDKTGRMVIPPSADLRYTRDFSEGLAGVVLRDGNWGFMDTRGEVVIRLHNVRSVGWFNEGLCAVTASDGRMGYIDRSGNFVIKPQLTYASAFSGGLALVRCEYLLESRRHLIIDTTGHVVQELSLDNAYGFSEGRAPVMMGDLREAWEAGLDTSGMKACWGFIDGSGNLVIPARFASVHAFCGGMALVEEQNGKLAYIDLDGNYVWQEN